METAQDARLKSAQDLAGDGLYGEAAAAFNAILEERPDDPEVLRALAGVMQGIGQMESSLALLADSVDASEPNLQVLLMIADQLAELGRLEESADFLLYAVCAAPENSILRLRTATLLESLGRLEQLEWLHSGAEGDLPSA